MTDKQKKTSRTNLMFQWEICRNCPHLGSSQVYGRQKKLFVPDKGDTVYCVKANRFFNKTQLNQLRIFCDRGEV